jgi:hypothetical protein
MDFDDMPDSYFAFLANQKKLAEPEQINGAMQDLARGSDQGKGKVKSRASQPNLGGPASSAPSVPSLPSIQKTSTMPSTSSAGGAKTTSSGPRLPTKSPSKPPSNPLLAGKPPSTPNMNPALSMRMSQPSSNQLAAPGKSNTLVFALIGVLIAAIAVLAYVVLTK